MTQYRSLENVSLANHSLLTDSDWNQKIAAAWELASSCRLCPRACRVDRRAGALGFCRAPGHLHISSIFPHHGEEPPLSGTGGSGTVFFSHCTLRCSYCQNHQISHDGQGREYTVAELATQLLSLQKRGCHNINLVTPTHFLPWILEALRATSDRGLEVPVVYNCGGYEAAETLAVLDGVVDIYLPDMKYADSDTAGDLSGARDYPTVNREAIRTMFRQVGPLRINADGIATRGLCIRHLVLPQDRAGSADTATFLASTFAPDDVTVSLMAQYRPLYRAGETAGMSRRISPVEYARARRAFEEAGIGGYFQEPAELNESFVIDFTRRTHQRLKEGD